MTLSLSKGWCSKLRKRVISVAEAWRSLMGRALESRGRWFSTTDSQFGFNRESLYWFVGNLLHNPPSSFFHDFPTLIGIELGYCNSHLVGRLA